ncbi:MAG: MotA/TolQ/ExbB proton channel family protein [Candidatus Omnitrophica bacterium]|nr:MotA/TolQ/ExbB proton channel family protein [Candidatus Omnitrophota bacterium]
MKTKHILTILMAALIIGHVALAQAQESSDTENAAVSFKKASSTIQQQLDDSLKELSTLREEIADEKIPLTRKLNELEGELVTVRSEYQKTSRLLDSHTLDLSNLRNEIKSRQEEATYLSNLLSEYIRNFESRLHISEIQRYSEQLDAAKLALENTNLSNQEMFQEQAKLLTVSLERLDDALGGISFKGSAVDPNGLVKQGTFVLVGPWAVFRADDGSIVGTAEQRIGSLEPAILTFENESDKKTVEQLVTSSQGKIPLDPTLGNAHKIEATHETLLEHVQKGGPVMVPIFLLAGAALAVALYKWRVLAFIRTPSQRQVDGFLQAIAQSDKTGALQKADTIGGPVGRMLKAGVDHIEEPRELIEEVMFEIIMDTRLKLQSLLPFVAISASSAPLLGLLGTVTGIINTFKLITVFGSGDVKTLSGGISEALITTKFGLIVAIPSLLMHAFLSRKARGIIDQMEKIAISYINQVSKTPYQQAKEFINAS